MSGMAHQPQRCLDTTVRPLQEYRDAEHGEREGDPKPRYDEYMVEDWVDYIKLDTAQNGYRALNKMWAGQPVLLCGTPLVSGLVGRWSLQQLVSGVLLL